MFIGLDFMGDAAGDYLHFPIFTRAFELFGSNPILGILIGVIVGCINGFGVAIPHTDAMYVLRETEGIMTLKEPVRFTQMGSDDTPVDVKVVFMLAIENPQTHIKKITTDFAYHSR